MDIFCAEQILLRDSASLSVETEHALRALVSPRGRDAALGVQTSPAAAEYGLGGAWGAAAAQAVEFPPSGTGAAWDLVVRAYGEVADAYMAGF